MSRMDHFSPAGKVNTSRTTTGVILNGRSAVKRERCLLKNDNNSLAQGLGQHGDNI